MNTWQTQQLAKARQADVDRFLERSAKRRATAPRSPSLRYRIGSLLVSAGARLLDGDQVIRTPAAPAL